MIVLLGNNPPLSDYDGVHVSLGISEYQRSHPAC